MTAGRHTRAPHWVYQALTDAAVILTLMLVVATLGYAVVLVFGLWLT